MVVNEEPPDGTDLIDIPLSKRKRRTTNGKHHAAFVVLCTLAMMVSTSQVIYFHQSAIPDHPDVRQLESFAYWKKFSPVIEPQHNLSTAHQDKELVPLEASSPPLDRTNNPFVDMLKKAGESVPDELAHRLFYVHDDWAKTYGTEPVILGMETCEAYRNMVPRKERIIAVAGLFNTGTNAMEFHLRKNIKSVITKWQVPWGKHRVPRVRLEHVAPGMDRVPQKDVLPIVILRDPLHWMQSMCKSPYAAKWKKTKMHCPNLVPTANDKSKFAPAMRESNNTFPVTVHFDKNQIISWPSLVHLYSDWYRQYLDADYPHLLVRFEDILWQAPAVLDAIAECVGTKRADPIAYQVQPSKGHGSGTGLLKAILKTGNSTLRHGQLTDEDLVYAKQYTDPQLLERMKYSIPLVKS